MDIEIVQNIVLGSVAVVIFLMYITSIVWDQIADELEAEK